jgi:hypothetical protein
LLSLFIFLHVTLEALLSGLDCAIL